jgi:hypothetical protein
MYVTFVKKNKMYQRTIKNIINNKIGKEKQL